MDKCWCDKFEGFGAQTIMSSCLIDRDLTNDISNLLRFNSGMTKLVVGLSLDEINFFSFESSKTLGVTRVIVLS